MSYGTRVRVVDDLEAKPNRVDPHSGNSADVLSAEHLFAAVCMTVDVRATSNDLSVVLVASDGTAMTAIRVPKNSFLSVDMQCRGFKHQNYTPGSTAGYEINGWYKA